MAFILWFLFLVENDTLTLIYNKYNVNMSTLWLKWGRSATAYTLEVWHLSNDYSNVSMPLGSTFSRNNSWMIRMVFILLLPPFTLTAAAAATNFSICLMLKLDSYMYIDGIFLLCERGTRIWKVPFNGLKIILIRLSRSQKTT